MKKAITLMILLAVVSAVFLTGCTSKTQTQNVGNAALTQTEISSNELTDETLTEWVDEDKDVQIGDIV